MTNQPSIMPSDRMVVKELRDEGLFNEDIGYDVYNLIMTSGLVDSVELVLTLVSNDMFPMEMEECVTVAITSENMEMFQMCRAIAIGLRSKDKLVKLLDDLSGTSEPMVLNVVVAKKKKRKVEQAPSEDKEEK